MTRQPKKRNPVAKAVCRIRPKLDNRMASSTSCRARPIVSSRQALRQPCADCFDLLFFKRRERSRP